MNTPLRVIQVGLGAIGRAAARLVLERENLELVGAVDTNPDLVGQDLGQVLGMNKPLDLPVRGSLAELLEEVGADAAIHCTGSSFVVVYPELVEIVGAGLHCVTSCEEALFPYYRNDALAQELNNLCISKTVSVVGTGVNPGFVMDTLPLVLTAVSQHVDSIRILRVVNAGTRRAALQRKVGAGMSVEEFRGLVAAGRLGHAGLLESLALVADTLRWKVENITETVEPMVAQGSVRTEFLTVNRGQVAGVHQIARAELQDREVLRLELQMYVGAENPRDEIEIAGVPPLKMVIPGGTPGDLATPAILVNMLPGLLDVVPGLHTMSNLILPHVS